MKNTLKYSLHMQKSLAHPDDPEKAFATLGAHATIC